MCRTGRVFVFKFFFLLVIHHDSGDSEGAPVDRDNLWGGQDETGCALPLSCCLCASALFKPTEVLSVLVSCLQSQNVLYKCVCVLPVRESVLSTC